ncbi:MAG: redox-sensing transcriptional repressor Rex [Clostridiales bacterium]|nr:redox-sensing transcriptional repressor Rex [Clostridiales bacterium]
MVAEYVSDAVIRRLPGYYRYLQELEDMGEKQISSKELGKRMGLTASQIRQDINCFGGFGRQGYGYEVSVLKHHIGDILGLYQEYKMIVIGAGNIGHAVANYANFQSEGFEVIGIFDSDKEKEGQVINGMVVQSNEEIKNVLDKEKVDIGVIAVPAKEAQSLADFLVEKGVKGIWNFAPKDIKVPEEVSVVNVHLSDSLQVLSFKMTHEKQRS